MATSQEKWVTAVLRYEQACKVEKKENYYTELSNNKTTLNKNNNKPLHNMKIQEAILKPMRKYE